MSKYAAFWLLILICHKFLANQNVIHEEENIVITQNMLRYQNDNIELSDQLMASKFAFAALANLKEQREDVQLKLSKAQNGTWTQEEMQFFKDLYGTIKQYVLVLGDLLSLINQKIQQIENQIKVYAMYGPKIRVNIGVGDSQFIDIAFDDVKPRLDIELVNKFNLPLDNVGYSYWFRYLTRYPKSMFQGKNQDQYFMSTLLSNQNLAYSNQKQLTRMLTIFQGQAGYNFIALNLRVQGEVTQQIGYGDIEGVWTFVYFCYSLGHAQAIGYIKYSGQDPQSVIFQESIFATPYVRLIIGGTYQNIQQSLNGQFTSLNFRNGLNAFIDNLADLGAFLLTNPEPQQGFQLSGLQTIITAPQNMDQVQVVEYITNPIAKFPLEYAVFGYFRWSPSSMENWHLAFRLHINQGQNNQNYRRLGDRTLAAWVSPLEGGIHSFSTYSYFDLNGNGNTNINTNIQRSQAALENWHFIFYGYNRELRKVEGFVIFMGVKYPIAQANINHYITAQMYLNVGRDQFYPAWHGQICNFAIRLGKGASTPTSPMITQLIQLPTSSFAQMKKKSKFEFFEETEEELLHEESVLSQLIGQNKRKL